MKMFGKWQKGNLNLMTSRDMERKFRIAGKGVMKPTAVEQRKDRWRIYYKPWTYEEGL